MKAQTRTLLSLCLAVVLVLTAVLGTIAYMTASSSVTNTFTVGSFEMPEDPDHPGTKLTNYIYEKNWDANTDGHKLVPDSSTIKDPKVGIGKGSEAAYVYVYIQNKLVATDVDAVYFTLNSGWSPVGTAGVDYKKVTVGGTEYYTGGLFKYDTMLEPTTDADAWTTSAIFDTVTTNADVNTTDLTEKDMVVNAYIHQAKDNGTPIDTATLDGNAQTWVGTLGA
ncbi:SipW-dependent-type signal peptide-containing protein [Lawsonibacter sp. LCP25S3_G6]|uniref:SipW-dependent-type signal peptide-containing protein n=1 Tax=unclassified Lawsonibacter TaxID=2617946 RepID=UPI003F981B8D